MKNIVSAALVAASLGLGAAQAQDVPAGSYVLDPTHTTVVWGVSHGGFSIYRGTFSEIEGSLTWDATDPTKSRLAVAIDANSVVSPDAVSHGGNTNFQEDIAKNALGADEQPTITFTTTRLERTGDDTGIAYGDLSFHGETAPVEMEVRLIQAADFMGTPRMGFEGTTTIDRSKWGSDAWTQFGIGNEVTISIQAEFSKAE